MSFITMVALLAAQSGLATLPTLGAVTVSSFDTGSCDVGGDGGLATPAQIQISWGMTNPDDAQYQLKVYENGVLMSGGTLACSATGLEKTITGAVEAGVDGEAGHGSEWTSDWTYRVDLVRLSDGVAVQTQSSSPWRQTYGVCGGLGGG